MIISKEYFLNIFRWNSIRDNTYKTFNMQNAWKRGYITFGVSCVRTVDGDKQTYKTEETSPDCVCVCAQKKSICNSTLVAKCGVVCEMIFRRITNQNNPVSRPRLNFIFHFFLYELHMHQCWWGLKLQKKKSNSDSPNGNRTLTCQTSLTRYLEAFSPAPRLDH